MKGVCKTGREESGRQDQPPAQSFTRVTSQTNGWMLLDACKLELKLASTYVLTRPWQQHFSCGLGSLALLSLPVNQRICE